ncbi:MAG: putative DNA binding domain-containing protein, partial [Candidatus Marinimicrobia bacterium]|nr:putative DNA binding domain-containing protein [Candidatus Neomarinimicrobiota bacterium]
MTSDKLEIQALIGQGEGISIEFKKSRDELPRNLYESICAFLNRHGGHILLGMKDDGAILGVNPDRISQMKKDFASTVNNPDNLNPPVYLSLDEFEIEGKTILYTYVPDGPDVYRYKNRIYDRNEDADLDITSQRDQVALLYKRKTQLSSESRIIQDLSISDLDAGIIQRCRKLASLRVENHPWEILNDLELIKSAKLYKSIGQQQGITLAGLLLFGTEDSILTVLPQHRTDLILRRVNVDRYDDRDMVKTNLIESYDRIIAFIAKHLPDPFYLEGTTRISLRDRIFREVASNLLIHREYDNRFPAKLVIENEQVRTENTNISHGTGIINPNQFTPISKNPIIASFFQQIGRADELGSGMRNLMKYGEIYGNTDPQLIEGDIFKITISVPLF